jgi:hypothetical protein
VDEKLNIQTFFCSGIKRSPYEAMFGTSLKVGLMSSSIPKECLVSLVDEESLEQVIISISGAENETDAEKPPPPPETAITSSTSEEPVGIPLGTIIQNTESGICGQSTNELPSTLPTSHEMEVETRPIVMTNVAESTSLFKCGTCDYDCEETETCSICSQLTHERCGIVEDSKVICKLCDKHQNIVQEREEAASSLKIQANKMIGISDRKHREAKVGSTVRIPVPDVDRGRGDTRSILAVVMEVNEDGFYKLGTRNGVMKQLYARSQFSTCHQNLVQMDEVPSTQASLRTVASAQSTGTGQGFFKCCCKTKCQSNRCACKKKQVLCNSKCHASLPCTNK